MITILSDEIRRAAHDRHVCDLCRSPILPGELHRDARYAGEGSAWAGREHLRCTQFAWRYGDWDEDGHTDDDFRRWVAEYPDEARTFGIEVVTV